MKKKYSFEVEGVKLCVIEPKQKELEVAQHYANKAFKEALDNGYILRDALDKRMEEQGLWNAEDYENTRQSVISDTRKLKAGGIKLSEGKDLALKLIKDKSRLFAMHLSRAQLDSKTAEFRAETTRFNYLVSVCTKFEKDGKPYFANYTDFINRSDSITAREAITNFSKIYNGTDENLDKKLDNSIENQFLRKYKFVNEKDELIDREGRRITQDGKFIDEQGRYIQYREDGTTFLCDIEGNEVNENGEYVIEEKEFLED